MANEIITDAGIITVDGSLNTIVIGGDTYTGDAYSQDKINTALAEKETVAAQGVSYEYSTLSIADNQTFVADAISMSRGVGGDGGAIYNTGTATILGGTFSDGRATNNGGAVYNGGTATILASTFTGNAASMGGAIYNAGMLTVRDSVFTMERDTIYNNGGTVTLEGAITLAADMTGNGSYVCVNDLDLIFINSTSISVSALANAENIRSLAFHGTSGSVNFTGLALTDTAISIDCALPTGSSTKTIARNFTSLGTGTITLNGEEKSGDIYFVDGGFYTVGLNSNNWLVVTRESSQNAGIICGRFPVGSSNEITIEGTRYSGKVYAQNNDRPVGDRLGGFNQASAENFILAVEGSTFDRCQTMVIANGHIGVIQNTWFDQNTNTDKGRSILTIGDGAKAKITGSTFTNGYNNCGHGGAIRIGINSELTLQNSSFDYNKAQVENGGVIDGSTCSLAMISGCTFTGNTAAHDGGVIFANRGMKLDISNSIFVENHSKTNAGVMRLEREVTMTATGCTFTGNYTGDRGGVVYVARDTTALFSRCVFSGNRAGIEGGAIHVAATYSSVTLKDCIFSTKSDTIQVATGTVIFSGTITLAADVKFGTTSGSRYLLCSPDKVDFVFINSESISIAKLEDTQNIRSISFNDSAKVNFAGLALSQTDISIEHMLPGEAETLTVAGGLTSLGSGTISVNGKNTVGDKVYISDNLYDVSLSDGDLTIEKVAYTSAGIVTLTGIDVLQIGGINYAGRTYNDINAALASEDVIAVRGAFGGRAVLSSGKRALIDESVFSQSIASSGDGGALVNNSGDTIISGSTFSYNTAVAGDGGAIANHGGDMSISGSKFSGNMAGGDGGAIVNKGGDMSISGSTFAGNKANGIGGAVFNSGAGTVTIRDSVFATATDTVCNNGGNLTLGGAIWTAANISSTNAVTIENDTLLALDLSGYVGTQAPKELITDFDAMFGASQSNLTISVNVASDLRNGSYALATNASGMTQTEFTVTIDGDAEKSMSITVGESELYGGREYSLAVEAGNLNLFIRNPTVIYVNSQWSGSHEGDEVDIPGGGTAYFGINAFADLTTAKTVCPGAKTNFTGGTCSTTVFGGGENGGIPDVVAETALTFNDGSFSGSVFAGNKIRTTEMLQTLSQKSSLDIRGGSYSKYVMGGDYLSTTQPSAAFAYTVGKRSMNISGGTFSGLVAGGSFIAGGTATLVSQLDGDIDVTLSGGTFNKRIYGGDITDKLANSTADFINGNIAFTLDASQNSVNINESIVCGSYGYGTVKGNVVFTVKGTGENLTFADTSVVSGGSGSGYLKVANGKRAKEYDNFVNGTSKAVFDGFDGDFSARLTLFDAISFDNHADVSLTNAKCNLAELSAWQFADGAGVTFCNGQVNDFTDDTLDIDLTSWDGTTDWTLATGDSDAAFLGFEKFKTVMFGNTEAHYETASAKWVADGISLSLSENKTSMVLAHGR